MMKMKKILFILPLLALAFVSCNSEEEPIFENSAAERLDISRNAAIEKLIKDGGLWAMEYFANADEPGYVMLFRFDKNGSVEVSANHKWINGEFRQERSLWTINSDNGTVLSFNSYNTLFHIFSDPANITGPNAPVNPDTDKDIDETGKGHEGDYEFMVMADSDEDMIRLLGKKRAYNIYMYRLPSDTNEQEYLEKIRLNETKFFSESFPQLIIRDKETGEEFIATSKDGKMSVYPKDGDWVSQTKEKCYITTDKGIRFIEPFEVLHADGTELYFESFDFTDDGSLENEKYSFHLPIDNYESLFFDRSFTWDMVIGEDSCQEFNSSYDAFKTAYDKYFRSRGSRLNGMSFVFDNQNAKDVMTLIKTGSTGDMSFTRNSEIDENGLLHLNISLTDVSNNAALVLSNVSGAKEFVDMLNSHLYKVSYLSALAPNVVILTDASDPSFHFNMQLR